MKTLFGLSEEELERRKNIKSSTTDMKATPILNTVAAPNKKKKATRTVNISIEEIEKKVIEYYDALAHDRTTIDLRSELMAFAKQNPESLETLTHLLNKHRAAETEKWKAFQASQYGNNITEVSEEHSQQK